jgi:glycyl-tRNA synthetase
MLSRSFQKTRFSLNEIHTFYKTRLFQKAEDPYNVVKCKKCGHIFRADDLLKGYVNNPEKLDKNGLAKAIKKHNIRCPDCGGELSEPERFNLMFSTTVGLDRKAYLRPETAQGIFVNFPIIYRLNREKLPFGVAQIGKGFRNEISPRQGLLRLREFNMAEIELFVDPYEDKKLGKIEDVKLNLLTRDGEKMKLPARDVVERKIVNPYIAYYMAKIAKFLQSLGIDLERVRFRQHFKEELAHYAKDTWDCEIEISNGWTEVIGIADRGDYDLRRHMTYSGRDLTAIRRFKEPKKIKIKKLRPRMEILGPMFKGQAKKIAEIIENMEYVEGDLTIEIDGKNVKIPKDAYEVIVTEETVGGERFIPHVVEPSFGIDRIFYSILEHSYYEREDTGYKVLKLKPKIAPIKAAVFPLMAKDNLDTFAKEILYNLRDKGIQSYYDDSGSIGRRYARADEIGVPFCITVDYESLKDRTVTIRDRDSTEQKRIEIKKLPEILEKLIQENLEFSQI